VDAASGVTGAGRKATEDYSFVELDGDFRAYKVLRHQHEPEMAQTLARSLTSPAPLADQARDSRTCYGRLAPGRKPAELRGGFFCINMRMPVRRRPGIARPG